MGMVYRSPTSSNTMVLPSGETSGDIQVPSDVVNETVRVVVRGRSPFFLPVSAATRLSGTVATGTVRNGSSKAARVAARNRYIEAPEMGVTAAGKKLKPARGGVKQNASGNPSRGLTES